MPKLIDDMRRLMADKEDPAGMVTMHAAVLQEEAVLRALKLAERLIRADSRLKPHEREVAAKHLYLAQRVWRDAPPIPLSEVVRFDQ